MVFYNNPPPPPSTNFSRDFPEKFFRSFKKNIVQRNVAEKNSCKQFGDEKKFVHRKIAQPPPQISNGPSLRRVCFNLLIVFYI